jgi:hypothetical protein
MMKKVVQGTSHRPSTWPVQPIYMMKNVRPETSKSLCEACTAYIYVVKICSRDFS